MEHNTRIDKILSEILVRFVSKDILTPELLVLSQEYLFGQAPYLPFFKDTELYEAVMYLKEVIESNQLHSANDLLNHYNKKKKAVSLFIDKASEKIKKEERDPFTFNDEIKWEKAWTKKSSTTTENPQCICPLLASYSNCSPVLPDGIIQISLNQCKHISTKDQIEQMEDQV